MRSRSTDADVAVHYHTSRAAAVATAQELRAVGDVDGGWLRKNCNYGSSAPLSPLAAPVQ